MKHLKAEVLVIGGGSTGTGVARDAAMRGFQVLLVDKGDLCSGTSGRFHGLLHSGGRYAVKDPVSAKECIEENVVLRRIAADCIEDTSGFFVCVSPWDDPAFGDRFVEGCKKTGVPVQEISPSQALRREPLLNPHMSRVFEVPDGAIDSFKTCAVTQQSAEQYGAKTLVYHQVVEVFRNGDTAIGARLEDLRSGEEVMVDCDFILNCSGAWAGKIAEMAGIEGVTIVPGKGTMVAMNLRLVNTVVNRCKMPSDGDILVPIHSVCVIGTTDIKVPDPDHYGIEEREVEFMMQEGEKLVPRFREARALRAWAGVRPLFQDTKGTKDGQAADNRNISRTYTLLDHLQRDGVRCFLTMTGGKFTTYRQMAEVTVNAMCAQLGVNRPCRTHLEPLPGSESGKYYTLGHRLEVQDAATHEHHADQLICECELISRPTLEADIRRLGTRDIDDLRRSLRLGMGPCQGGFCTYRTAGILHQLDMTGQPPDHRQLAAKANRALADFLQERWKGQTPILWGRSMRQVQVDAGIFYGLLGIDHLIPPPSVAPETFPEQPEAHPREEQSVVDME